MSRVRKLYAEHEDHEPVAILSAWEARVTPWIQRRKALFDHDVRSDYEAWEDGRITSWELVDAFHRVHPGSHAVDAFDNYSQLWAHKHKGDLARLVPDVVALWERNLLPLRRVLRAYSKAVRG